MFSNGLEPQVESAAVYVKANREGLCSASQILIFIGFLGSSSEMNKRNEMKITLWSKMAEVQKRNIKL